jgi:amino acid adenylation domain-containing protein
VITLLQEYAAAAAAADPEATAIVLGGTQVSYRNLVAESRRIARLLGDVGVGTGDRVALMMPKSPQAIVGMHGVLEAGAAYVPIDLASPAPRTAMVISSSQPSAVLAAEPAAGLVDALDAEGSLGGVPVISLDPDWRGGTRRADHGPDDWSRLDDGPLDSQARPDSLAHILFTSGSTGVPKGVQITHGMVTAYIEWAVEHFGTSRGERISGHPPLHFDLSTFDIYATLKAGAELHLVPSSANLTPGGLAEFIRSSELTQWFSVPSTLAFMVRSDVIEQDDFPSLRRVLFCGEAMPTPVLAEWMRRVPHASYTNLYGPTEATIASSYYDVPGVPEDESESLPIGLPCAGEDLLVLDEERRPLPAGETGEIYISGVGLSPGYWRDEEKTDAAFVEDPESGERIYATGDLGWKQEDGVFRYVGRADSQIKHRGYRIELGEIERALDATGELQESAVVAVETEGFEGTTICCAYVARGDEVTPVTLRSALTGALPAYMLPTSWRSFDSLPKNQNGKIDRRALREAFELELAGAG